MTNQNRITKKLSIQANTSYPLRQSIFEYDSPEDSENIAAHLTTQPFTSTDRYKAICENFSKFSEPNNYETVSTLRTVESKTGTSSKQSKEKDKIECKDRNWLKRMFCWKHTNTDDLSQF